jgi:hypothetical protein
MLRVQPLCFASCSDDSNHDEEEGNCKATHIRSITVTGHSLGGALASLCGWDIAEALQEASALPEASTPQQATAPQQANAQQQANAPQEANKPGAAAASSAGLHGNALAACHKVKEVSNQLTGTGRSQQLATFYLLVAEIAWVLHKHVQPSHAVNP